MNQPHFFRFLLCAVAVTASALAANPSAEQKARDQKNGVFNVQDVEVPPVARVRMAPSYPAALRDQGVSGKVVVEFIIDRKGDVAVAAIVSSTDARFDEPCLAAVKQWKFKPARVKGKPVNCRATQLLEFSPP